jgi:hypothetical protein
MMNMLILAILFQDRSTPGPLDAFRANFSALRVQVRYEYRHGGVPGSFLRNTRPWLNASIPWTQESTPIQGSWEFDGTTQRIATLAIGSSAHSVSNSAYSGTLRPLTPELDEIVFDDRTVAWHTLREPLINCRMRNLLQGSIGFRHAPFLWFETEPFPALIDKWRDKSEYSRFEMIWDSHPLVVETYRCKSPDADMRFDIAYDPNLGYLPRRYRKRIRMGSNVVVSDFFLESASATKSGAFLPTSWFVMSFTNSDHDQHFPHDPGLDVDLYPTAPTAGLAWLKTISIHDLTNPVAVESLERSHSLACDNGIIPIPQGTKRLTLDQIRSLLGHRLTDPRKPVPVHSDLAELAKYSNRRPFSPWPWILGASFLVLLVLTAFVLFKKRNAALLILLAAFPCLGCESQSNALPRLSLFLDPEFSITDADPVTLQVRIQNHDHRTVQIFQIDGG